MPPPPRAQRRKQRELEIFTPAPPPHAARARPSLGPTIYDVSREMERVSHILSKGREATRGGRG